ncbi:response regulator [Lichenihabitans sp. Uapishka_5]|uniref:response regulator n=1 Tax=Lichenihabitans sp. Uapishka_5 TaxID=3037302 RepID=UPI0029E7D1E0|nr:response regulator [Lichenihabitans sp. Uapishka_5]MDX7950645.1 response regulator [Lichenihabitans sp. Uapishka_5]
MTHVLVVDDSPVIRKVARRIFEKMQLEVSEAVDGQAALDSCTARMPDLILLDWNMPVLDGFGFLRELRRLPTGGEPKVVLCTTENDVAHMARARHAGANAFLMKPFDQAVVQAKCSDLGVI